MILINKSSSKFLAIQNDNKAGTVIRKKKHYFIVKTLDSNIRITEWFGSVKKGDKFKTSDGEEHVLEDEKTPLGEFILSYYDRETGAFPKGETAVLTMVEKDYGEQFIEPAKAFIEQVQALFDEYQMQTQPQQMEVDTQFDRMKELAGLR